MTCVGLGWRWNALIPLTGRSQWHTAVHLSAFSHKTKLSNKGIVCVYYAFTPWVELQLLTYLILIIQRWFKRLSRRGWFFLGIVYGIFGTKIFHLVSDERDSMIPTHLAVITIFGLVFVAHLTMHCCSHLWFKLGGSLVPRSFSLTQWVAFEVCKLFEM